MNKIHFFICDIWVMHVGLDNFARCIELKVDSMYLVSNKGDWVKIYSKTVYLSIAWAENISGFWTLT